VPYRDVADLARTRADAPGAVMCSEPTLGVKVPDRGKALVPSVRSVRLPSSLLIESPTARLPGGMPPDRAREKGAPGAPWSCGGRHRAPREGRRRR